MANKRAMINEGGLTRMSQAGDGVLNPIITTVTADAADTLTVAKFAGGITQYTGLSAGRVLTTDSAANILAAYPGLNIGESVECIVSITTAFALTLAAGATVTLAGRATVPASSSCRVLFTKTSATAVTCTVL